jgi:hypothetical protein
MFVRSSVTMAWSSLVMITITMAYRTELSDVSWVVIVLEYYDNYLALN